MLEWLSESICACSLLERKHLVKRLYSKPYSCVFMSCSVKEASTGYFEDYNKLRHEGGKLWVAPKTLIQEKVGICNGSEGYKVATDLTAV